MIRIEIEAIDAAHCRAQLQELLRMYPSELLEKFKAPEGVTLGRSPVATATEMLAKVPQPIVDESGSQIGEVVTIAGTDDNTTVALVQHPDPTSTVRALEGETVTVVAPTPEQPAKRGRGRPPKNKPAPDNAGSPAGGGSDNTGSGSAANETPTAGTVMAPGADIPLTSDAAATVAAPSAPAPATNAQMRAALQELVEAAPDMNTGQLLAKEILAAFKYQKVGQVQDEHLADIIALAKSSTARVEAEGDKEARRPIFVTITAELAEKRSAA